ncbi:ketoacyl-ACP synthase III [Flavobacteriales bacterium]|nr:ketoacyl-ACP synthase III [Flavobacteriales bacterium]
MSSLVATGVRMVGLSAAVPNNREDNQELASLSDKAKNEIIQQVGIRYRYVAPDSITASDLCESAATKLLSELNWNAEDIELLVFVSQTPDHLVPGSATQLQTRLGLPQSAMVIDVNQGCAGYVYGMSIVSGLMKAYGIPKALLLVGDTITKMVSRQDNSIWPIFSDAGSATAFELDETATEMNFKLGSKGEDFKAIHIPDGGFRSQITSKSLIAENVADGIVRQKNQLSMNGQAVFTFGLSTVAKSILEMLEEQKRTADSFDYLVLHQANQLLNNSIVRKAGFKPEQSPSSLSNFGNTSCATVPVTLVSQLSEQLRNGHVSLMLSGFGVGLSWASVTLETENIVCPEMIYV